MLAIRKVRVWVRLQLGPTYSGWTIYAAVINLASCYLYASVLEAVLHLCQHGDGDASPAQARFLTLQTPKKVRNGLTCCDALEHAVTSLCNASYDVNAMLMLSQVAKVLAAVYGMRANADPTLVVACLHAVRGLATRHEGNAHALGKETLLCIRSLSKANANNADLVGTLSWTRIHPDR